MSLLMEALRKAEEAKSKASKEEKEASRSGASSTAGSDPLSANIENTELPDQVQDTPEAVSPRSAQGPVVINPDPDEAETLASHASDSKLELLQKEAEDEFEQIEFATGEQQPTAPSGGHSPETAESTAEDLPYALDQTEDDDLSLLQSSYFSRTRKSTGKSLADEFDDQVAAPGDDDSAASIAFQETPTPAEQDEIPTLHDRQPAAATGRSDTASGQDRKAREKTQRESAGALFRAKENSRKQRLKKQLSIAAIIMLFPLAGIVYWLFTSLGADSGMQFNVPGNTNGADFAASEAAESDAGAIPATAADTAGTADTAATGADANSEAAGAADEASPDSTADTLMAMADNDGAETPDESSPANTVTENVPDATPPLPQANPVVPTPEEANTTPQEQARTELAAANNTTPDADNPPSQVQVQNEGLSFTRTAAARVTIPDLNAAYDSYQQGDYTTAARLYQQVLATEPNNRDALLHLATLNLQQNNPALAQNLYRRLLELNPRDPLARAGILETVQGDPGRQEAELKSLIAAYPATAPLSFALGNLYATQNRWNEAQSAYFEALLAAKAGNSGPVSPDYAFNLAVSLERISQWRSALEYYREAETLSRNATPGFDPALLEQRLNTLEDRLQ